MQRWWPHSTPSSVSASQSYLYHIDELSNNYYREERGHHCCPCPTPPGRGLQT
jgi:hypothetical protein